MSILKIHFETYADRELPQYDTINGVYQKVGPIINWEAPDKAPMFEKPEKKKSKIKKV